MTIVDRTSPARLRGPDRTRAVVVGVDGSERNHAAVAFAAAYAEAAGRPLTLVTVVNDYAVPIPHRAVRTDGPRSWAALSRVAADLKAQRPGLAVREEMQLGDTVDLLLSRSAEQDSLVVGKRGLGTFGRLLVGSTSTAVAGRSHVPVVVVPDVWRQGVNGHQPVVVGVDLEQDSEAELTFAFSQAAVRGVPLRVLHVLDAQPMLVFDPELGAPTYRYWQRHDEADLEKVVAPYAGAYDGVQVSKMVQRGDRASVLLDESADAQLVVLGRHHRGRFGFSLGSVVRSVLHYSEVAVAVAPSP